MGLPSLNQMAKVQCKISDNQSSGFCLVSMNVRTSSMSQYKQTPWKFVFATSTATVDISNPINFAT